MGVFMRIIAVPSLLLAASACTPLPESMRLSPFSDRAKGAYSFEHKTEIIRGVVWSFEATGEPVIFSGPLGLQTHSFTYVVEIKPKVFDLPDAQSVLDTDPSVVAELIEAANLYCEATGYTQRRIGAGIHSTADSNLLMRHCLPPGAEIANDAKVGDDIQRNPFIRAFGVPPLRGKDFSDRYGVES